jgi:hypothetical protein
LEGKAVRSAAFGEAAPFPAGVVRKVGPEGVLPPLRGDSICRMPLRYRPSALEVGRALALRYRVSSRLLIPRGCPGLASTAAGSLSEIREGGPNGLPSSRRPFSLATCAISLVASLAFVRILGVLRLPYSRRLAGGGEAVESVGTRPEGFRLSA